MSIVNLAGNFQPLPNSNGSSLPQNLNDGSTISNTQAKTSAKLVDVTLSKPSIADLDSVTENNKINNSIQDVQNEIEKLQQFNQSIERSLHFEVDEELGVTIVRVVDKETEELIRQFPPEELINLSRRLKELKDQNSGNTGVLLQEKV